MNRMRFDVKCVKDCLVKNQVVYTVMYWEGYTALSNVEVDGIGLCTKRRIMQVTGKEDLAKYTHDGNQGTPIWLLLFAESSVIRTAFRADYFMLNLGLRNYSRFFQPQKMHLTR